MKKTTTEAEIRALVGQGKKFPQIASELGVDLGRLRTTCSLLGIKSPKLCAPANAGKYFEGVKAGLTLRQIGDKHGVSHANVHMTLRRAGLPTSGTEYLRRLHQQQQAA